MSKSREAYVQGLKALLHEWDAEIERLAAKAHRADEDARVEYNKKLDDLRKKRKDLEDKIDTILHSGEDTWEDLKQGLENSWGILKASLSQAKSEFVEGYRKGMEDDQGNKTDD